MTITLADNNAITDGHAGSDVSKWRLNISSQDGKTNFSCTLTVTGTTQDATAAIQACAAPLPPAGGGGGNFVVKPISCATNMVFTMAGVPPNTSNTAFTVNLNCNVSSSSVVGPSGGTIQQGAVAQFTLIQNNVGGFAFPWPSNFIDQPTIQGAANATTNASFWYDGTNWHAQTFPASGGGAANAAGILGDVQRNNGAGGLAVAGINDNGTTVRVNEDISFKGPNPYSNIMAYAGYSNASPPSTTASTTNGSAPVTVAALQLVEQGSLDLEAPIDAYCPEFAEVKVLEGFEGETPRLRAPASRARRTVTSRDGQTERGCARRADRGSHRRLLRRGRADPWPLHDDGRRAHRAVLDGRPRS